MKTLGYNCEHFEPLQALSDNSVSMRFLTLLFLLLLCTSVRAQIGLHPPSVDWQQIELPQGRIIFPQGFEDRAKRVATLIELLETKHTGSIGEQHYPFDLVLQTTNTTINGYVGLAPFRSEFFLTPPQQQNLLSTTDWADLLTIHEFRHVQQASNERRGITKLASWLFGQQGWLGTSFLATPNWFSEGDAVIFETALSNAGRGRTPAFSATLRSLLAEDQVYNYQQARNGSFRRIIPDHYRYGYAMLTYGRERFGHDMWKSVLHDGASYRGIFYPFSRALRRKTGMSTKQFYFTTMDDLAALQDSAVQARGPLTEPKEIGQAHSSVVNYRFPQAATDGQLVALRSGFQYRPALVRVAPDGGKDELITYVGIQREPYVDVRENLAVWMESRLNPRYTNERFSEVILYELNSGRKQQLTERGKYFMPTLSHDRKEIAVVRQDPLKGNPELVIMETQSGAEKEVYRIAASALLQPRFSEDGKQVYFLHQNFQGIAIQVLERGEGKVRTVRPRIAENIDHLRVSGDWLTFSSGRDGVDNVYQYNPATGATVQLTNEPIGALFPRMVGEQLVYVNPTPKGMRLRMLDSVDPAQAKGISGGTKPAGPSFFERPAAYAAEAEDLSGTVVTKDFAVTDVSDKLHGFKVHSWGPVGDQIVPGISLAGNNALNTVSANASVFYNTNDNEFLTSVSASYGGWFPVITAQGTYVNRSFFKLEPGLDTAGQFIPTFQNFRQTTAGLNARVPLQWINGEFQSQLVPGIGLTYYLLDDVNGDELPANFVSGRVTLTASAFRRRALQQVMSTLGASLSFVYDQGLADNTGNRFLLNAAVQLPGVARTHGVRITYNYRNERTTNPYQYSDGFQYARGYEDVLNDAAYRVGINYQLPLVYPEFGIFGIYYLKRLRLNAFFDHGRYRVGQLERTNLSVNQTTNSVGGQFLFDSILFNTTADISFGVEGAYLLSNHAFGADDQGSVRFRFLAITIL